MVKDIWQLLDMAELGAVFAAATAVAVVVNKMFAWLDQNANRMLKVQAALWILGAGPTMNWREQAAGLLDRCFGEKHLSWRCFGLSAAVSIIATTFLGLVYEYTYSFTPLSVGNPKVKIEVWSWMISFGILFNVIPDFFSLLESRFLLRIAARRSSVGAISLLLIFDIVFSVLVVWVYAYIVLELIIWVIEGELRLSSLTVFLQIALFSSRSELQVINECFLIVTLTSLTTSIWLWLYAIALIAIRVGKGALPPNRWFSRWLDIKRVEESALVLIGNIAAVVAFLGVCVVGALIVIIGGR